MPENEHLSAAVLTPLEQRIAVEKPDFLDGVKKLKKSMMADTYARCIERIHNITKSGNTLMIVADSFMHRSLIEKECIPAIKEAFAVTNVRVAV